MQLFQIFELLGLVLFWLYRSLFGIKNTTIIPKTLKTAYYWALAVSIQEAAEAGKF